MNILFLSTRSPYPLISGHSLRTYYTLKGAAERHNVSFVTFIQLRDELKKENLNHLMDFCRSVYPFRIPVDKSRAKLTASLFLNLFTPLPFVAQKYNVPLMRHRIREIIKRDQIDLVHVDMLPLTVFIDEFAHLPRLLVNHNVESIRLYRWFRTEVNVLKKIYLGIQYMKLRSFERSAMNKFDAAVVVSEIDLLLLKEMGITSSMFVVPNGTDTTAFKPTRRKSIEDSVLWLGHMDVHTNRDAVLYFWREIYPILRRNYPQVRVTIVGTSPPREIVGASRQDTQVRVTGFVDDVRPYLEEAAVMVVPIRIGSGTRLKILDAMAMGKSIVSTSIGCEGLRVTHGKDIFIADNPKDFALGTIELLKNRDTRVELQKHARSLAETYDWANIQQYQEQVYQTVMKGRTQ